MDDKNNQLAILEYEDVQVASEMMDFDALEQMLEAELEVQMSEFNFLEEEKKQINNPDALGENIKNVVWEQFLNQIAVTAGEDFIKENRGLTLDLRDEAHIQTTENFASGKIASHNTEIDYQQRYDDWQSNFAKDADGKIITHQTRTGKDEPTLAKGARAPYDADRPKGSAQKHTDMDHTVSAAEIIRDPGANAHMTKEEQIAFANSEANLNEMDSSMNRSKGDKSMSEWLDNPNANGQKPSEIFDISPEEEKRLREKDKEAREEYKKEKQEGEERSIKAGKESQKQEALRIGGKALRAVVMQLLAELVKEIVGKLVKWFKSVQKNLESLIDSIKNAVKSFVRKLKTHLVNAGNTLMTTIVTAIIGPVVGTIKKVWTLLKQGWKSIKEAVAFLSNPENKKLPMNIKLLEVGKIIMAGLTGAGALVLGEMIEKGLMTIPVFAFEIPLIGSLANIIGIFMGAVVAGIIGAIVINLIDKFTAKNRKAEAAGNQVDKGNEAIQTQRKLYSVTVAKYENQKSYNAKNIRDRHVNAAEYMREAVKEIFEKDDENEIDFDEIDAALDGLLE